MQNSRFQELFIRWCKNQTDDQEDLELAAYFKTGDAGEELAPVMQLHWETSHRDNALAESDSIKMADAILARTRSQHASAFPIHRVHFLHRWGWAAASVILLLGIGTFLWNANKNTKPPVIALTPADIAPGKEGAILTLADGAQVSLDTVNNATVALQAGVIAKIVNGTLIYDGKASEVVYNIMTTPKGREFRVTLPDGTEVWLNSASSIRYPTMFSQQVREVKITGEAFLKVMKDKSKPFIVDVDGRESVEVLGTSFNVNAYEDEAIIKTTLVDGSIHVTTGRSERYHQVLQPGQQAQIAYAEQTPSTIKVVNNVDTDKVVAWKNGLFNFEDMQLPSVMRQLSRWYDIEVRYQSEIPDIRFGGEIRKSLPLNDVLSFLGNAGLHVKTDGRTLTVMP